jgi:hypothetical protein
MSLSFTQLTSWARHQSTPHSTNITTAPDLPWRLIGSAEDSLLSELQKMYWEGVRYELEVILFTLKKWQQPEYSSILLDYKTDDFIHGYDTFINQVSQESRAFAIRYGMYRFYHRHLCYYTCVP